VSRFVRRSLLLAVLALVALPFTAVGSGAQQLSEFTVTVKKVVVGTGGPSAVTVDCSSVSDEATAQVVDVLNFDAQGNPVASGADTDFAIQDGAWVLEGSPGSGFECTFTESAAGGASSTSWTCAYSATPNSAPTASQIELAGCQSAAGAGTGPVDVTYPGSQDVSEQASTVVFTNTFGSTPLDPITPAPQVVAQPVFTG
jgi:hypothetical protein